MGYSSNEGRVRVDIFKESGKWYSTASVDMSDYYNEPLIHEGLYKACMDEFHEDRENWGLSISIKDWIEKDNGFVVCIEPYHENSHPICIRKIPCRYQSETSIGMSKP